MPNLDNIFNKFFPQSQTTKKGVFLLRMAWGVEILVAFIGLCVGILIIRGAQGVADVSDLTTKGVSLNDLTIGMIFIIVAVVELTKIPLATAVYYSVRLFWRIVFLIALILVNVSTFETIITGFEIRNREVTKIVDQKIVEYNSIKKQIENINENVEINNVNRDIEILIQRRTKLNEQIGQINLNTKKQIQNVKDSNVDQASIDQLRIEIEEIEKNIENLLKSNTTLSGQKDSKVFGSNKKGIDETIKQNNIRIEKYENDKIKKNEELKALIKSSTRDNEGQISIINQINRINFYHLQKKKNYLKMK